LNRFRDMGGGNRFAPGEVGDGARQFQHAVISARRQVELRDRLPEQALGRRAVSGSHDNTLRVWDFDNGQCLGVYSASAGLHAVAIGGYNSTILAVTVSGEVGGEVGGEGGGEVRGLESGPAVLTTASTGNTRGTACGSEFPAPHAVIVAIHSLRAHLAPDQSPCLDLPETAFSDARLLSQCPHCDAPVKFNPFLVDVTGE